MAKRSAYVALSLCYIAESRLCVYLALRSKALIKSQYSWKKGLDITPS